MSLKKLFGTQKLRYLTIILGILVFLPPIAFLPRIFGSMSLCASPFCIKMIISISDFSEYAKIFFVGVVLLTIILITTFFFGRFWCSHLCPIGGSMELVSKAVPKKLKLNYTCISAPSVRYGYFLAFLILPVIGVGSICCGYCHITIISHLFGSIFNPHYMLFLFTNYSLITLMLVVLLGFFARGGRAYCNFLCPIGALDALFNWFGSKLKFTKRIRIDEKKCNGCGLCKEHCPLWAIEIKKDKYAKINQLSCMPCKICEEKCPENAISLRKG